MSTVTGPGIYRGLPESVYHADSDIAPELGRSLSQSGAKTLLSSPARFAWEREHGRPSKDAYDLGTLAHVLILGSHDDRLVIVDAYDWRTKAAQEAKAAAYAEGKVPVHRGDLRAASRIARAVRRHPLARAVLASGEPEVSFYWRDPETGVTCRARVDWLVPGKALVDVKTVGRYGGADPAAFGRQCAQLDYPMQAAHYVDGWEAVTGERLPFVHLIVETEPPHFVTVGQLPDHAIEAGRAKMRAALTEYAERESAGDWPEFDHPNNIVDIPVPGWYGRTE